MPNITKRNELGQEVLVENHWDQPVSVWTDEEIDEAFQKVGWVDAIDYIHLENEKNAREAARGKHEPPMYV